MTTYRILVAIALLGLIVWLGFGAWLVGRDLWRRFYWNRRHDAWTRRNAAYLAKWKTPRSLT